MAFVFKASLTEAERGRGVATPFDSGGCIRRFVLPAGANGVDFVRRHEMPLPDCREYLSDLLSYSFVRVQDYLTGEKPYGCPACGGALGDPHGLEPAPVEDCGLDRLHEVRVPERVDFRLHLAAVIVPDGLELPVLAPWRRAGVHIEPYDRPVPPSPGQTHALREAATNLILTRFLS